MKPLGIEQMFANNAMFQTLLTVLGISNSRHVVPTFALPSPFLAPFYFLNGRISRGLHSTKRAWHPETIAALRSCDTGRPQALIGDVPFMSILGDAVAEAVLQTYDALPRKCKPVEATADFFQWVPLSGIVVVKGTNHMLRHYHCNCRGLCFK